MTKPSVTVRQHAGAALIACTGSIESVQWTQTGGPSVSLVSDKTRVLDFEAPSAGTYTFDVRYGAESGAVESQSVSVTATESNASSSTLTLRANHAVRMGGNVSVRAWPNLANGQTVSTIAWMQTEGPAVALDTRDPYVALFVAPTVSQDRVIRLKATLTTTQGTTSTDEVVVAVERYDAAAQSDSGAVWNGDHVSRVYAYKNPSNRQLVECVYSPRLRWDNLCPTSQAPFLAQATGGAVPTVEQVMDRVLVSHDWLGRNFETYLRTQDPRGDVRRMLMSVTAVVLGVQVRPSFYYAGTGAIYLDANNFWLTPEERDTVNEAPDFRSSFGAELQYSTPWRYTLNNQSIFVFFNPRSRQTRASDYLLYNAGWLMFHELAHALDFMPPSRYAVLNASQSAWGNIQPSSSAGQLTSNAINNDYPLTSVELRNLGQVLFFGATADDAQRAYTPAQVAGFFAGDRATDDYAYASIREDVALLLEEFMLSSRFGIRRDMAVADKLLDTTTGSTLAVRWGQRGRVADVAVKPRVRSVVSRLVPWIDPAEVDALPAPIAMRVGESWTANLTLPSTAPGPTQNKAAVSLRPWAAEDDQAARTWQDAHDFAAHRHLKAKPLPAMR